MIWDRPWLENSSEVTSFNCSASESRAKRVSLILLCYKYLQFMLFTIKQNINVRVFWKVIVNIYIDNIVLRLSVIFKTILDVQTYIWNMYILCVYSVDFLYVYIQGIPQKSCWISGSYWLAYFEKKMLCQHESKFEVLRSYDRWKGRKFKHID